MDGLNQTKNKHMQLLDTIVKAIDDKKGDQITILDLRDLEGVITDYFVVCSATSTTQVSAIAGGIEDEVILACNEKPIRIQGTQNALWVAMDYGNVMIHIFLDEMRDFYRLEELWADAVRTDVPSSF